MTDHEIGTVLTSMVAVINPVIDALAHHDPLGIKAHTFEEDQHEAVFDKLRHTLGAAANFAEWPGTKGWEARSMEQRAGWWITRIGTLNTTAVAYPGLFGAWTKRLPLSSTLGFANQAMVIVAIAREYGVEDRHTQVRLLGSVLCARDIAATDLAPAEAETPTKNRRSLVGTVWRVAKIARSLLSEMNHRPEPAKPFQWLSYIPLVGAPATFVGERFALSRAAKQARAWIEAHPDAPR